MIQNSRLEDKESLLNRDFIEKRKEDFLLTLFLCPHFISTIIKVLKKNNKVINTALTLFFYYSS